MQVSICEEHTASEGCTNEQCDSLHICPYYIYDLCEVPKCEAGHDIHTDHNHFILNKQFLGRNYNLPDVKKLLEPGKFVPDVCEEYNLRSGCDRRHECLKMHLDVLKECPVETEDVRYLRKLFKLDTVVPDVCEDYNLR
ncbi:unnamed protein product, partial [Darwinula stevensoni]